MKIKDKINSEKPPELTANQLLEGLLQVDVKEMREAMKANKKKVK